jgi:hypothetical protein
MSIRGWIYTYRTVPLTATENGIARNLKVG